MKPAPIHCAAGSTLQRLLTVAAEAIRAASLWACASLFALRPSTRLPSCEQARWFSSLTQGSLAEELERAEADEARFREARMARAREMNRKVSRAVFRRKILRPRCSPTNPRVVWASGCCLVPEPYSLAFAAVHFTEFLSHSNTSSLSQPSSRFCGARAQRRALAEAAAMARGALVHGDDADSDEDDQVYAGMHSGVLLEGFEHLDVDEVMVRFAKASQQLDWCPIDRLQRRRRPATVQRCDPAVLLVKTKHCLGVRLSHYPSGILCMASPVVVYTICNKTLWMSPIYKARLCARDGHDFKAAAQLMQAIYASLEDSYSPPRPPTASAGSAPRSGAQSPSAHSEGGASAGSVRVRTTGHRIP